LLVVLDEVAVVLTDTLVELVVLLAATVKFTEAIGAGSIIRA
jgi:hypothetical protein